MDITINGQRADIVLEDERTIGDVLAGLEQWLAGSRSRISGLSIDGQAVTPAGFAGAFNRDLGGVKSLALTVSSWAGLAAEAYAGLRDYLLALERASFPEREGLRRRWRESPSGSFLSEEVPDFYLLADKTFKGDGLAPGDALLLVEERLRELADPLGEILNAEALTGSAAARLEDLPLDIQTGKDARAAETVRLFSQTGEKLFRLFGILRQQGLSLEGLTLEGQDAGVFIEEFDGVLRELAAAYGNSDTVLAGDLAEYELAPRLRKFYEALKAWAG